MWRAISHAVAVTALLQLSSSIGAASGFQVSLTNKCNEPVEMWHVVEGSERMEVIGIGKSTSRTLSDGSPSNVFKKGRGGQATCAYLARVMLRLCPARDMRHGRSDVTSC